MSQYEATFDIDSKSDAQIARVLAERVYDTVREETREVSGEGSSPSEMLEDFEAIREAAGQFSPGTLTIRFDQSGESFEQ